MKPNKIMLLVNEQAEDEGLWFEAHYLSEHYFQKELRKLHLVIESVLPKLLKVAEAADLVCNSRYAGTQIAEHDANIGRILRLKEALRDLEREP